MGKNVVFIDTMQFMNFNPDKLVKNLSDEDFKYLVKEFGSKNLRLLKQKSAYPYDTQFPTKQIIHIQVSYKC